MGETLDAPAVDLDELRASIGAEYAAVAAERVASMSTRSDVKLAVVDGVRQ